MDTTLVHMKYKDNPKSVEKGERNSKNTKKKNNNN